jgi:hypothetical protein
MTPHWTNRLHQWQGLNDFWMLYGMMGLQAWPHAVLQGLMLRLIDAVSEPGSNAYVCAWLTPCSGQPSSGLLGAAVMLGRHGACISSTLILRRDHGVAAGG